LATYSSDKSNQQPFPPFHQASWGIVKRAVTFKTILTGIALVGSGGYFTTLAYVKWVASSDENKIKERFNNPITITEKLKDYVPRTDVESSLKKILTADEVNNYWVISGEHGTGKTTTVQKVCNEIGKGIIYVDVPEDVEDFKDALANAIGLNHRKHGGIWAFIHETVYGQESLPSIFCYLH
jgi:HrpA-like RNA helicase